MASWWDLMRICAGLIGSSTTQKSVIKREERQWETGFHVLKRVKSLWKLTCYRFSDRNAVFFVCSVKLWPHEGVWMVVVLKPWTEKYWGTWIRLFSLLVPMMDSGEIKDGKTMYGCCNTFKLKGFALCWIRRKASFRWLSDWSENHLLGIGIDLIVGSRQSTWWRVEESLNGVSELLCFKVQSNKNWLEA